MRFFLALGLLACGWSSLYALDREAFRFTHYDLEVRVDPDNQVLAARGKIVLRNDSAQPQTNASLQISSSLTWRLIESGGKPLPYLDQSYPSDIDHTGAVTEAVVTLPAAVPPGGSVEVEVGYSGAVAPDATRLTQIGVPADTAAASEWDQIGQDFTALRGVGHVAWYPVSITAARLSENSLFPALGRWQTRESQAEMRMRLCWVSDREQPPTLIANGRFAGITGKAEGEATRTGCSEYRFAPLGNTLPTFAIGNWQALSRPVITVYHAAEHKNEAADYALAAEKQVPFLSEWFGEPSEKVQVIELPQANDVPFETGAMIFMPLRAGEPKSLQLALAHQLTHAAFHSPRMWIAEGLAHFAQALVRENQDGRKAALSYMGLRLPALVELEKQTPAAATDNALIATNEEVFYRIKAAYVWWMLRDMLGDTVLRSALTAYRPDQDKDPIYLQRLLEKHAKRNLESFFDDWVYRDRGLPDFRIASVYPRQTLDGGYVITVTVENLAAAGAEVPLVLRTGSGTQSARLQVGGKQKAVTRIQSSEIPFEAVVNDGSVPESDESNNTFEVEGKAAQ